MSQTARLEPVGFFSYARKNDEASDGALSRLRQMLRSELQQEYGYDDIEIWQDVAAIPPGAEWERTIEFAIANSSFLIPVITPAFVQSENCGIEFRKFLVRERQILEAVPQLQGKLRDKRLIFPLLLIELKDDDKNDAEIVAEINKMQTIDVRDMRRLPEASQAVKDGLIKVAETIAEILRFQLDQAQSEYLERLKPKVQPVIAGTASVRPATAGNTSSASARPTGTGPQADVYGEPGRAVPVTFAGLLEALKRYRNYLIAGAAALALGFAMVKGGATGSDDPYWIVGRWASIDDEKGCSDPLVLAIVPPGNRLALSSGDRDPIVLPFVVDQENPDILKTADFNYIRVSDERLMLKSRRNSGNSGQEFKLCEG